MAGFPLGEGLVAAGLPPDFGVATLVGVTAFLFWAFGDSTTFEGVEDLDSLLTTGDSIFGEAGFETPLPFGDGFGEAFEGVVFGVAFPFFWAGMFIDYLYLGLEVNHV